MSGLTHDQASEELAAVALDSVSAEVRDEVRAHAAACPECGPELAEMERTVATLGHLVPAGHMNRGRSAGIRSRIVMRARAERESKSVPVPGRPDLSRGVASLTGLGHRATPGAQRIVTGENRRVTPPHPQPAAAASDKRPIRMLVAYAAVATIALAVTAFQLMRVTGSRRALEQRIAAVDTLGPVNDSLSAALAQKNAMLTLMTGTDVTVVPLMNQESTETRGRVLWNRSSNEWMVIAHDLRQPREGMVYQVWLVTTYARISAGTFTPDSSGRMMMQAKQAVGRNALRAVAITEEPAGGMPSPTGPTVATGSV
jgi:hypothetical protein